ncbi:MAG: APC family permease [Longimicrobiales bacterium]
MIDERADPAPHATGRLTASIGVWSATAVVVGTIIGSGIFRVPATVAAEAGTPGAVLALWVVGGFIALAGALSLAELGAAFPRTGGIYVFLKESYGPLGAFLFGWGMLVVNPASYGAVSMIFAASVDTLVPLSTMGQRWVAAVMIVVLVLINCRSVRFGAAVQNASTAAKVAVLLGLAVLGLALGGTDASDAAAPTTVTDAGLGGLGLALVSVMFAYDGWQWMPQLAAEVKQPRRTIPRAMGGGVLIILLVYLIVNVSNLRVLSFDDLASSPLVTADVATRLLGAAGTAIVAALIALATFSSNNGGFMTDPRVFYAMAEDGLFFRSVAAVHPRYHTPHIAVIVTGAVALVYIFVSTFERMAATLILGMWPFLFLSVWSLIRLRRTRPDLERPFRVPLYPWLPAFFLLACVYLFANSLAETPLLTLGNFAILAAGIPVYRVWRARN